MLALEYCGVQEFVGSYPGTVAALAAFLQGMQHVFPTIYASHADIIKYGKLIFAITFLSQVLVDTQSCLTIALVVLLVKG